MDCCQVCSFFIWCIFWEKNLTLFSNSFLHWNILKAFCAYILFVTDDLWNAVRFAQTYASSEGAPYISRLSSENINLIFKTTCYSRDCILKKCVKKRLYEGSWLAICIHNIYTKLKHLQLRYLRFFYNPLVNLIPWGKAELHWVQLPYAVWQYYFKTNSSHMS